MIFGCGSMTWSCFEQIAGGDAAAKRFIVSCACDEPIQILVLPHQCPRSSVSSALPMVFLLKLSTMVVAGQRLTLLLWSRWQAPPVQRHYTVLLLVVSCEVASASGAFILMR